MKQVMAKLNKRCVVCGKRMSVSVYHDGSYRGGHYFGIVPLEKPKRGVEYWECPTCYWGPAKTRR